MCREQRADILAGAALLDFHRAHGLGEASHKPVIVGLKEVRGQRVHEPGLLNDLSFL